MSRVVMLNHITLDGVMQGPGRSDEDTRGGFEHGGWSMADNDEVMGRAMAVRLAESGGLLLGRRSYEDMLAYWNTTDSPFKDALNKNPSPSARARWPLNRRIPPRAPNPLRASQCLGGRWSSDLPDN
jgi:hypothetical protein